MDDSVNHLVTGSNFKIKLWSQLLILVGFYLIFQIIGGLIGILINFLIFHINIYDANDILSLMSGANGFYKIIILQASISLFIFLIAPILYIKGIEKRKLNSLNPNKEFWFVPLVVAMVLVVAFIPFNNGMLYQWNSTLSFPDFLYKLDNWIKEMERGAEQMTKAFTHFTNLKEFFIAFIIMAIIPGIGEELLFRGILQPKLHQLTKNIHIAIWLTAFIFSFIHFQFYGFLPRMVLGAMFGYIYIWSGNIYYPMFAHFTNNGFSILMLYLYQNKIIQINIDKQGYIDWWEGLLSLSITILLLVVFRNFYYKQSFGNKSIINLG